MTDGYWGAWTYGGGDRVPLIRQKCTSAKGTRHTCRGHETHTGKHRCICGVSWEPKP